LGYLEFLNLMANARLVLSDSGGIQEETTILGVPLRQAQGRPFDKFIPSKAEGLRTGPTRRWVLRGGRAAQVDFCPGIT